MAEFPNMLVTVRIGIVGDDDFVGEGVVRQVVFGEQPGQKCFRFRLKLICSPNRYWRCRRACCSCATRYENAHYQD